MHSNWRELQVTLEAAAIYKSKELVDYYYNVGLAKCLIVNITIMQMRQPIIYSVST